MRACLPILLRLSMMAAACGSVLLLQSCQSQPPPLYAWAKGRAEISPIQRNVQPAVDLETATENQILNSPSHQIDDQFGASMAMSLNTLVVGAPGTSNGGAAWVYDMNDSNAPPVKLVPPRLGDGDAFGTAVAISDSGRFIAVGAPKAQVEKDKNVGVVHVWENKGNEWIFAGTFTGEDVPAESFLGSSVAIGDDTLLAGAPFAPVDTTVAHGVVVTWMRDSLGEWSESVSMMPDPGIGNARFGGAMTLRGTMLIIGAAYARAADQTEGGIVYIFQRRRAGWSRYPICQIMDIASLVDPSDPYNNFDRGPGNHFGWSVCIRGNIAIVGSPDNNVRGRECGGSVSVFEYQASATWAKVFFITAPDERSSDAFGSAVGLSGTQLVVGAPLKLVGEQSYAGAAYLYQVVPGSNPLASEFVIKLVASHPRLSGRFGAEMACTPDVIAISEPGPLDHSTPGQVCIFRRSETSWGVPTPGTHSAEPSIKSGPDGAPVELDQQKQGEKAVPSSIDASSL